MAEGETWWTVTVTLSEDPERTVTVPLTKTEQDGASSADYSGVPASVDLRRSWRDRVDFTFTAASDSVDDDGESVKLASGTPCPTGVSAGNTNEAVVTITDDDAPSVEVSFEQGSYSVDEGDTVDVTVTLSEDPERVRPSPIVHAVRLQVTIPPATTRVGHRALTTPACQPASSSTLDETEQTFTFTAASDSVDDDGESVKLTFGNPADRGECWEHRRGCGHDHGRRRAVRERELRARDVHGGRRGAWSRSRSR